ncbi:phenylacetic acid degradation protein PaaY [Oceanospirillum maris]|uniref:phenylacetic acid degradation protein PaaY n=1 Tax=Oceanospirillum maris TaxID=64977 RepID=UPI0003F7DB86|nr:phenylacetic acid degradation protein PaaY [Oceanospirillum maris]
MHVYSIDGIVPVVDPTAFVHPTAVLIGDVIIGPNCYIGPNACLRGDFGRLVIKKGANVQDTCVMHGFPGTDTIIEEDGHIGHGAVLHGCHIGKNALIGMNAVIMDNARIGESAIVAACGFVKADFECPPRSLMAGTPAKVIRELSDQEIAWKGKGTAEYQNLTVRSLQTMQPVQPLTEVEADRKRIEIADVKPLYAVKKDDDQ